MGSKCVNCGKDYHYCSSCGYIPECEWDCCSDKCAKERISKLEGDELYNTLAEKVMYDVIGYDLAIERVRDNKEEVGLALLNMKLDDYSIYGSASVPLEEIYKLNSLYGDDLIEYLAELIDTERLPYQFAIVKLNENRLSVGCRLVDKFLENYDSLLDYPTSDKD